MNVKLIGPKYGNNKNSELEYLDKIYSILSKKYKVFAWDLPYEDSDIIHCVVDLRENPHKFGEDRFLSELLIVGNKKIVLDIIDCDCEFNQDEYVIERILNRFDLIRVSNLSIKQFLINQNNYENVAVREFPINDNIIGNNFNGNNETFNVGIFSDVSLGLFYEEQEINNKNYSFMSKNEKNKMNDFLNYIIFLVRLGKDRKIKIKIASKKEKSEIDFSKHLNEQYHNILNINGIEIIDPGDIEEIQSCHCNIIFGKKYNYSFSGDRLAMNSLACGCYPIYDSSSNISYILSQRGIGSLVQGESSNDIAYKVLTAYESWNKYPALFQRLRKKCIDVANDYSETKFEIKLLQDYENLLRR